MSSHRQELDGWIVCNCKCLASKSMLVALAEGVACLRARSVTSSVMVHHLPSASAAVTSPAWSEERGGLRERPGAVRQWAVQPSSNNEQ